MCTGAANPRMAMSSSDAAWPRTMTVVSGLVTKIAARAARQNTVRRRRALDEALRALEAVDPRKGRIVELRYFVGLGIEETAHVMSISPMTVRREWTRAKAWLYRELAGGGGR